MAWAGNPGSATSVVPCGAALGGRGIGNQHSPILATHGLAKERGVGLGVRPRVSGRMQQQERTLRLLLTVEVGPCPHGVRRRAGGWQALWGRLQAPRTHCLVRAAHRRVYREVGNGGYSWASIFALSCVASIPKVTPTSGPKVAAAAPDITPAPRLSGRRSVKAPPPPFTDTPGKRHCHV